MKHQICTNCVMDTTDSAILFDEKRVYDYCNMFYQHNLSNWYTDQQLRSIVSVPLTALGGAGTLDDIRGLVKRFVIIGLAAGSLFVFKGNYSAILINYPVQQRNDKIIGYSKGIKA